MRFLKTMACILALHSMYIWPAPLVFASLMIKNEQASIQQTLEPLLDGGITHFLIFDTGSTDKTLDIIHELFARSPHAELKVFQEEFVDFATSRNRALQLTEDTFPDAVFIVMLDAEWYLHNTPALFEYCTQHIHDPSPAHVIRIVHKNNYLKPILMRRDCTLRYKHPVHEELIVSKAGQVPATVFVEFRRSNKGETATQQRWLRDKEILLRAYENDPSNTHALFYLGQTCCCLDDYEGALLFFEKCIPRAAQELRINFAYEAAWRSAMIIEELINLKPSDYSWDQALAYYHKANDICPYRAEPLYQIANHYYKNEDMAACFAYALKASLIPFPSSVTGPIEVHIYNTSRYTLLHSAALRIGEERVVQWCREKLNLDE